MFDGQFPLAGRSLAGGGDFVLFRVTSLQQKAEQIPLGRSPKLHLPLKQF
jgi:hypothetical protein